MARGKITFVCVFFLLLFFSVVVSASTHGGFYGATYSNFGSGSNYWQGIQPSFNQLYSSGDIDLRTLWPILNDFETDQCEATTDFIIGIPPGGCSPNVVRSDLIAEQRVPVFCQLYSIKVNPLIDVSSIKTISFKGDYPEGVSGISFHPARAATKSYRTLLGDPVINNIGYVVIILDQERVEDNLEEWISGNLTATIRYDAEEAYGTGRSEHYLSLNREEKAGIDYSESSFWDGRGTVRLEGIGSEGARISVYSGEDRVRELTLEEGETSTAFYFPGYYCRAGLKVRVNKYVAPEDSALLNVDGEEFWVREGTKILNGQCQVRDISVEEDGSGSSTIVCPGNTITLSLSGLDGEEILGAEDLEDSVDTRDGGVYDMYFMDSNETVRELVRDYPSVLKDHGRITYAEEALHRLILLSAEKGKYRTQYELMELFLQEYPTSVLVDGIRKRLAQLKKYEYKDSVADVYVSNKFQSISVVEFKAKAQGEASVELRVGRDPARKYSLDEEIPLRNEAQEKIFVRSILPREIEIEHVDKDGKRIGRTKVIRADDSEVFGGVRVDVRTIDVEEVAHIEILPEIKRAETEANFSFAIGVEKRLLKLSPEKTEELLENINESIKEWEDVNERLGNLIEGWKGACFATSSVLMLKTMAAGLDGESIAREKVMNKYRAICDAERGDLSRSQCYTAKDKEIDDAVEDMAAGINSVNAILSDVQDQNHVQDEGLFGSGIRDNEAYKNDLRDVLGGSWSYDVEISDTETIPVVATDLRSVEQIRSALLLEELQAQGFGEGSVVYDAAKEELDINLRNVALLAKEKTESKAVADSLAIPGITADHVISASNVDTVYRTWSGKRGGDIPGVPSEYTNRKVQLVTSFGGAFLVVLHPSDASGYSGIDAVLKQNAAKTAWAPETKNIPDDLKGNKLTFYTLTSRGECSNRFIAGTAELSFYESGVNRGLPAFVPFDLENGWYVHVPNSGGTLLDSSPQGYTAAAEPRYFEICNVGRNGLMETRDRDLCQTFDVNTAGAVSDFLPCPSLDEKEVRKLFIDSQQAIREASQQYGQSGDYRILGEKIARGPPATETNGLECQDFMSPSDCNLMFNVCDPVICPASRCDLGGRLPVSNVVQSGIVGSVALCLPNFPEVRVPVCLTGIHAGIDSFTSILKSEAACLEQNLETGEHVGICDEITSVYKCEFFWNQLAPLTDVLIPKTIDSIYNGELSSVRGGGEYSNAASAWNNLQESISFFRNTYAESTFRAFELKNVEEAGGEFCKAFIGTSFPTSADALDSLLEPESPYQFYAEFDEHVFTDATLPSTSQYKVYYHIYAGNDQGVQYRVFLKNPPASSYYASRQTVYLKTGYIARGSSADETLDFTLPSGYKELCVEINGDEECGFKKVTTNFAVNYIQSKYVQDQAEAEVTTENECVSGNPSAFSFANLNLQSGAEEFVSPEIALRGIVRVCASTNPGEGIVSDNQVSCLTNSDCGAGYECKITEGSSRGLCTDSGGLLEKRNSRWKDIGYCGDVNVRCFMDMESVEKDLERVEAIEGVTGSLLEEQRDLLENTKKTLEDVRKTLEQLDERVRNLNVAQLSVTHVRGNVTEIERELDTIIGTEDVHGAGTNADRANALVLKAELYNKIVRLNHAGDPPKPVARPAEVSEEETVAEVDQRPSGVSGDSFSTRQCKEELGKIIYDLAEEIKVANGISDSEVKSDTGAKSFACLALQVAYQESKITQCKDKDNLDCLYCEGQGKEHVLKSTFPREQSYGVMQINLDVHKSMASDIDDMEAGVRYALGNVLIPGKKQYGAGRAFEQNGVRYTGWKAALRSYNGWGKTGGDRDYVESVIEHKGVIEELFPVECGDGTVPVTRSGEDDSDEEDPGESSEDSGPLENAQKLDRQPLTNNVILSGDQLSGARWSADAVGSVLLVEGKEYLARVGSNGRLMVNVGAPPGEEDWQHVVTGGITSEYVIVSQDGGTFFGNDVYYKNLDTRNYDRDGVYHDPDSLEFETGEYFPSENEDGSSVDQLDPRVVRVVEFVKDNVQGKSIDTYEVYSFTYSSKNIVHNDEGVFVFDSVEETRDARLSGGITGLHNFTILYFDYPEKGILNGGDKLVFATDGRTVADLIFHDLSLDGTLDHLVRSDTGLVPDLRGWQPQYDMYLQATIQLIE